MMGGDGGYGEIPLLRLVEIFQRSHQRSNLLMLVGKCSRMFLNIPHHYHHRHHHNHQHHIGYLKDLPIYQTLILLHIMMMSPHECTIAIVLWLLYSVHTVDTVHNHLTVQNASGHAASGSSRHQQLPPFPRWNILGFWDYEIFWMRSNIFHLSKTYGFRITHF